MIFDGQKFRRSTKVVPLARNLWTGDAHNFVAFGRVCKPDHREATKTNLTYPPQEGQAVGEPVYAAPIVCDGHSLTNLMYGKDGYAYLMLDGKVYTRKLKKKADAK